MKLTIFEKRICCTKFEVSILNLENKFYPKKWNLCTQCKETKMLAVFGIFLNKIFPMVIHSASTSPVDPVRSNIPLKPQYICWRTIKRKLRDLREFRMSVEDYNGKKNRSETIVAITSPVLRKKSRISPTLCAGSAQKLGNKRTRLGYLIEHLKNFQLNTKCSVDLPLATKTTNTC